jgi:hypothetical protein
MPQAPGGLRHPTYCTAAQWRVIYRIDESKHAVIVEDIRHRSAAYRRR